MTDPANPILKQLLPSGISPEGAVAIPARGLLAPANEYDGFEDGAARAHVMLYAYQDAPPVYPHLTSAGADRLIGWGANSGMVADVDGILWAVNDSFYGFQPRIFKIDTTRTPARIVDAIDVTRAGRPAQGLDMEGITLDGAGNFYVVSEGRLDRGILHAIYHVRADGEIAATIPFPKEIMAVERRWAAEGITRVPLSQMQPAPLDGPLPVVTPEDVRDLIPDLKSTGGYVLDKVEGLAITEDGTMWVSTDNDGVDDHSGETMLFAIRP
jgi:hypothetical protein